MKLKGLLLSFTQFSMLTALSRILGLVRDVCCAHFIGAGASFDAFLVAFQIPNFMRKLFGEGAMSQAFVPVLSECQVKQTKAQQKLLIARVMGVMLSAVLSITILVWLFAPWVIKIYAPGFVSSGGRFALATKLLYWTFPYLIFISFVALFSAILNCYNKFSVAAFAPVLLNVCLILGSVWGGSNNSSVHGLAIAVPVAGLLQFVLLIFFTAKEIGLLRPRFCFQDKMVLKVWRLMLGALFGVSIAQLGLIIDTFLASFLPIGSVSWLYFSQRLVFLPLGLFGVAAAVVILPKISKLSVFEKKQATIEWALVLVAVLAIPAATGLFILAKQIVICLFNYGAFDYTDVMKTQNSLKALATGLPAFMLNKIFIAVFYADQNIKDPVKIGGFSLLVNVLFAVFLMQYFDHVGVALAASISAWAQSFCLIYLLKKRELFIFSVQKISKILLANFVMIVCIVCVQKVSASFFGYSVIDRVLFLSLFVFVGIGGYGLSLFFAKWRLPEV